MPTFKVKVHMEYPSTVITECVEVIAESLDQAIEFAENGDGFLISESGFYPMPAGHIRIANILSSVRPRSGVPSPR